MDKNKQRIKIAEVCGWKRPDDPDVMKFKQGWTTAEKWWMCPKGVLRFQHEMPNYSKDLNAIQEAILWCAENHNNFSWKVFETHLGVILRNNEFYYIEPWRMICATAEQRAEALLRTLRLWEEN